MSLRDELDKVNSRNDLQRFILELRRDLIEHPEDWDNSTLETFLEALAGWTHDMAGYFGNQGLAEPTQPDWRLVGRMLFAASTYE